MRLNEFGGPTNEYDNDEVFYESSAKRLDSPKEGPFACYGCDGAGGWETEYAAHSQAISPSYRETVCPDCDGSGTIEVVECEGCYRPLEDVVGTWHSCFGQGALCGHCVTLPELHSPECLNAQWWDELALVPGDCEVEGCFEPAEGGCEACDAQTCWIHGSSAPPDLRFCQQEDEVSYVTKYGPDASFVRVSCWGEIAKQRDIVRGGPRP